MNDNKHPDALIIRAQSIAATTDLSGSLSYCKKCQKETNRDARGSCKACAKERFAAYRAANYQRELDRVAAYRAANPDRVAAYRAENIDKTKEYGKAYRAANPEKERLRTSAHYAANTEKRKAVSAAWKLANADRVKAYNAAWAQSNQDHRRINEQNRRARKLKNGGTLSKGLSEKLLKLQKGKCACCNLKLGENFHLDHIMPLAKGGVHTDQNIQILCPSCNLHKQAKHPIDFMQSRGLLL